MKLSLINQPVHSLISALVLCIATGLAHTSEIAPLLPASSNELQSYLSSHSYKTPESCPKSADQGSCWARSIMRVLSDQQLRQLYNQVSEHLKYSKDQPINAAALHLYLESYSAETPDGATPGIPINNLNIQLAILLQKKLLTVTLLPDGLIATQTLTGFEDGSYEVEENVISLSEEPEALFMAILSVDISLLLTPGVDNAPGHVQPILFNLQPHQTPEEVQLKNSLDSILNRPARVMDIFAASSGDIPSYFFSALRFGATELTELRRERKKREEVAAKAKLEKDAKVQRDKAAEEYHQGDRARFCKNCAKSAAKLGIIGAASAVTYQKWETVKSYALSFWNRMAKPLGSYMATLPKKAQESWTHYYPKVSNALAQWTKKSSSSNPTQGFPHQMLTAVNAIRSKPQVCGSTPMPAVGRLSWDHSLEAAAFTHSTDMASRDFMDHTGTDGSSPGDRVTSHGYNWSVYAENVAAGQANVDAVLKSWMTSEGHCKNIMSPDVIQMGASFVEEAYSEYGIYWTQVFATPKF
ncbi:MAG: CAP domain-containing protein [Endozoicomonas sp.]|uniref:CAP domain-containing protein n=1 Tax=Endozoicomonas sp. TaxID=1892382 RepID=UPI003D9AE3EB